MAADQLVEARPRVATVGAEHDVRIQHGQQPLEVAVAGRRQERFDHRPLAVEVGVGDRRALDPAAAAAGELARRVRGPADDRRDVVERDGEDVVEHERDALGRGQGVEDRQQRQADRVAEDAPRTRGRSRPADSRSDPGRGPRAAPRDGRGGSAAGSGRPGRRPWSARPAGSRRRSCRSDSAGSTPPARRHPPRSGIRACGRPRHAGAGGAPRSARRASPGRSSGRSSPSLVTSVGRSGSTG